MDSAQLREKTDERGKKLNYGQCAYLYFLKKGYEGVLFANKLDKVL
jgi:hypothetical protein